jgi:hypothetical protein
MPDFPIPAAESVRIAQEHFDRERGVPGKILHSRFVNEEPRMHKPACWLVIFEYCESPSSDPPTVGVFVDARTGEAHTLDQFPI